MFTPVLDPAPPPMTVISGKVQSAEVDPVGVGVMVMVGVGVGVFVGPGVGVLVGPPGVGVGVVNILAVAKTLCVAFA
jgi:hypothetical protein